MGNHYEWGFILELDDVVIQDSSADYGGAISTSYWASVIIENSLLQRNVASYGGGAIHASNITIVDSIVQDNHVAAHSWKQHTGGGGIYIDEGTVIIHRSLIQGNRTTNADLGGGGLLCVCYLILTDSTLRDNTADLSGNGGGLAGDPVELWIIRGSTISGNDAEYGSGGGVFLGIDNYYDSNTQVLIENSTISGNSALLGGGLYLSNHIDNGSFNIRHTTIASNTAMSLLGAGGGIFLEPDSNPVTLTRNIVYGNTGTPTCYPSGDLVSAGFNLLENTSCGNHPLDQVGVNPQLGPLSDNGGPTYTHALLPNSPAIDAALCLGGISTDQRGAARPQGAICDSGAFEFGGLFAGLYLPLIRGNP